MNVYVVKDEVTQIIYERVCGSIKKRLFKKIKEKELMILNLNLYWTDTDKNVRSNIKVLCYVIGKSKNTLFVKRVKGVEI